jgi:FKBP-type peptidyl-prolyl cis-trans isomerase
MKEGGKRRILIPAAMAYGDADLVFDITLHKVEE